MTQRPPLARGIALAAALLLAAEVEPLGGGVAVDAVKDGALIGPEDVVGEGVAQEVDGVRNGVPRGGRLALVRRRGLGGAADGVGQAAAGEGQDRGAQRETWDAERVWHS